MRAYVFHVRQPVTLLLVEGAAGVAFAMEDRRSEDERIRSRFARFFLLATEVGARGGCFYRLADSAGKYIRSWRLRTLRAISLSPSLVLSLSPFASHRQ